MSRSIRHRVFTESQDFAGLHLTTMGAHGGPNAIPTTFTLDMYCAFDGLASITLETGKTSHGQILDAGQMEALRDGLTAMLNQIAAVPA